MLVVRKAYSTLKDSCFTELKWAIKRLQVEYWWEVKKSPLEMTYKPTGQKIYFRGLDDPFKITSVTVEVGVLSWLWIEESYEISNEADFEVLVESQLGACPEGVFKQVTLTFNPWNEKTWIKRRFFDTQSPDVLAMTTTYKCNEWLSDADKAYFEAMKIRNPRRYQVAGLGEWGVTDGLIYENWEEVSFDVTSGRFRSAHPNAKLAFGLDFGYTNDPTALFCGMVDLDKAEIYVFNELYKNELTNSMIYNNILGMGYTKEKIIADSAEPKSIEELREAGLYRIRSARKGKDSVNHGIQYVQGFKIIIHPRCVNFLKEIANYTWAKDKFGNKLNRPIDDSNHLMDAMRYAMEEFSKGDVFSFE